MVDRTDNHDNVVYTAGSTDPTCFMHEWLQDYS